MTQTQTQTRQAIQTATNLGYNKPVKQNLIGIIVYNKTTGQKAQVEVTEKFWTGETPTLAETIIYLFEKGHGQMRCNTIEYRSLV